MGTLSREVEVKAWNADGLLRSTGTGPGIIVVLLLLAWEPSFAVPASGRPCLCVVSSQERLHGIRDAACKRLGEERIPLVEPARLQEFLAQGDNSVSDLQRPRAARHAGTAMRCEGLVLIAASSASTESDLLRVRLVDTRHGFSVLNLYVEMDADLDAAARYIQARVTKRLRTLVLPLDQLVLVGLPAPVPANESSASLRLASTLHMMLKARLQASSRLVMLDEEDFRSLGNAPAFREGPVAALRRSAVLVRTSIAHDRPDSMGARISVSTADGVKKELPAASINVLNPGGEGLALTRHLFRAVAGSESPPVSESPQQTAFRIWRQGEVLAGHGMSGPAVARLEAATVLLPDNPLIDRSLLQTVLRGHLNRTREAMYEESQLARLVRRSIERIAGVVGARARFLSPLKPDAHVFLDSYFKHTCSAGDEAARRINAETRVKWRRLFITDAGLPAEDFVKRLDAPALKTMLVHGSATPRQMVDIARSLGRRLGRPPERDGWYESADDRIQGCLDWFARHPTLKAPPHWKGDSPDFKRRWLHYVKTEANADDPFVALAASLGLMQLYSLPDWGGRENPVLDAYCRRALKLYQEHIQNKHTELSEATRTRLRNSLASNLFRHWFYQTAQPERAVRALEKLLHPSLREEDAEALAVWGNSWPSVSSSLMMHYVYRGVSLEFVSRLKRLLTRVDEILGDAGNSHHTEHAREQTRRSLAALDEEVRDWLELAERRERTARQYNSTRGRQLVHALAAGQRELRAIVDEAPADPAAPTRSSSGTIRARMLMRADDWPRKWQNVYNANLRNLRVQLWKNMLWIAFSDALNRDTTVGVAGIDLGTSKVVALWQTRVRPMPGLDLTAREQVVLPFGMLTGFAVGQWATYVAVAHHGILEFPGPRKRGSAFLESVPDALPEKEFPSRAVSGIALADDRELWVAYGSPDRDCGVGILDPKWKRWRSMCRGGHADESHPLFNSSRHNLITAINASGDNVYFATRFFDSTTRTLAGGAFWHTPAGTFKPEKIIEASPDRVFCRSSRCWFLATPERLTVFDPVKADISGCVRQSSLRQPQNTALIRARDSFFIAESCETRLYFGPRLRGGIDLRTADVHGKTLWVCRGTHGLAVLRRGVSRAVATADRETMPLDIHVLRLVTTSRGMVGIGIGTAALLSVQAGR